MRSRSLASRLLVVVLTLCLVVTTVCAITGYIVLRSGFIRDRAENLKLAVAERARLQGFIFGLVVHHADTASELLARQPAIPAKDIDKIFNALAPDHVGAVRFSTPELFSGQVMPGDEPMFGMGVMVSAEDAASAEGRAFIVQAAHVVRSVGQSRLNDLGNLSFITPGGSLIIFNPTDRTKLAVMRSPRPSTVPGRAKRAGPTANPERRTICASLTIDIGGRADTGPRITRSCTTPAYVDGRYVGAWTTILNSGSFLPPANSERDALATDLLIDGQGQVIALSGDVQSATPTAKQAAQLERDLGLRNLAAAFQREPQGHGVMETPDHRSLVGFARLEGAPWFLVTAEPKAPLEALALRFSMPILTVGVLALLGTSLAILLYAQRQIVTPLRRLTNHSQRARSIRADASAAEGGVADLQARADEIGELAGRLAEERARADEVLQSLEDRVAERTAELERANRAKSTFLANMSHELRTPLNGVVALSDILASRQTTEEDRATAELVVSSARLLEQVLTDILDVSKIEADQMTLDPQPFDLQATVDRIAGLHSAVARTKAINLVWSVSPEARGRYVGDQIRITQILSNLLSNAVKFTAEGEVSLTVTQTRNGLSFAVRDSGLGFPQDVAERLFRRFEQADASTTRQFGGTGLGLAICASLCALMGGSISAASTPGSGATFTVLLPLERAAPPAEAPDAAERGASTGLEGLRVLQAEDHPTNQKVVALSLEPFGVVLSTVENGAQAVQAFAEGIYDIILMDLHMPVMDGLTAIAEIRAREAATGARRTPIIALTADAMAEQVQMSRDAGADGHLAKPIRPRELVTAIVECLSAAEAAAYSPESVNGLAKSS